MSQPYTDFPENQASAYRRIIPLQTGFNFRDLGGYRTRAGTFVRWHRLYRSARLNPLSQSDIRVLEKLGIQTLCDLRSQDESQAFPSPGSVAPHYIHLPLNLVMNSSTSSAHDSTQSMMQTTYRAFVHSYKSYHTFFELLLDPTHAPLLFHCTAGKDRTGLTAALVLWALDVPDETIVEDFQLSNQFTQRFLELVSSPNDPLDSSNPLWSLVQANPANLDAAWDEIKIHWGSLDNYFTEAIGLPQRWRRELQSLYCTEYPTTEAD